MVAITLAYQHSSSMISQSVCHNQHRLVFAGKARSLSIEWSYFIRLLALAKNIILGWKKIALTNTLSYFRNSSRISQGVCRCQTLSNQSNICNNVEEPIIRVKSCKGLHIGKPTRTKLQTTVEFITVVKSFIVQVHGCIRLFYSLIKTDFFMVVIITVML